jgi:hypothetical protein
LFAGIPADRRAAATAEVKKLQRLYQVTPSDEAMKVLLDNGFSAALELTAMSYDTFLARYGPAFPSTEQAAHTYRKAQQVAAVTNVVLGGAKQLAAAPAFPFLSPAPSLDGSSVQGVLPTLDASAGSDLIKQFPTLESLFGSPDFCECPHCRSVLSPAAYLVDLLKFLDPDPTQWAGQLSQWQNQHGGAAYPYPDMASWNAAGNPAPVTPYEALRARRPDLPSCC